MLFEKKKSADEFNKIYFDTFKKTAGSVKRDFKKFEKDFSDIDKAYKILTKNGYNKIDLYGQLFIREDKLLLTILYKFLSQYKEQGITINNEVFSAFFDKEMFLYNQFLDIIQKILYLCEIEEDEQIGYSEFSLLSAKYMFEAEKNRLQYIKDKMHAEHIKESEIDVAYNASMIPRILNQYDEKDKYEYISDFILTLLQNYPEDSFEKL